MLLIKNGYMIDPKSKKEGIVDILIRDSKIVRIAPFIEEFNLINEFYVEDMSSVKVIDAADKMIAPGLIDVHVHFRDPGFTYKEDIESGAKAAAKGGFTTVVMMANTNPVIDNAQTLSYALKKGKATGIHVESCCCVTKGLAGKELVDMKHLIVQGAIGFTDDGMPLLDESLIIEAMKLAKSLDVPISFHEENPELIADNGIHYGKASDYYEIGGSPRSAEIDLVARDLLLALQTGAKINIQHVSTKESVELIRQAKAEGNNIYAEVTPHHFTLTQDSVIKQGALAKMNPPLREKADQQAIIKGLKDGTIDMIATDHAPHSQEEKEKKITEAPSGIIGLETALGLGITNLVKQGHLTYIQLLEKWTSSPADLYNLDRGYLAENGPADLIIFNNDSWKVSDFLSKSCNSPFIGETLQGKVEYTICNGEVVYQNVSCET